MVGNTPARARVVEPDEDALPRPVGGCYTLPSSAAVEHLLPLSLEQVRHIAHLVRLGLTDDEVALYAEQLSEILDYAQMLQSLDTSAIPPTAQVLAHPAVLREDEVRASLPTELALDNAPHAEDGYFVVAAILEQS